jgi:PPOX class probable F420-dependent enzyme
VTQLPDDVRDLLDGPNLAHVATVMADGMPHVVPIWIGTMDDHVLFLTGPGSQKARNLASEPRVSVSVADRDEPTRMAHIRGRVTRRVEDDEAWAIIDQLAQVYIGGPYPRGMDRVVYIVTPERAVTHRLG